MNAIARKTRAPASGDVCDVAYWSEIESSDCRDTKTLSTTRRQCSNVLSTYLCPTPTLDKKFKHEFDTKGRSTCFPRNRVHAEPLVFGLSENSRADTVQPPHGIPRTSRAVLASSQQAASSEQQQQQAPSATVNSRRGAASCLVERDRSGPSTISLFDLPAGQQQQQSKPTQTATTAMRDTSASAAATAATTTVKVPKFVRSLYDILHHEDKAILSWSANGTYFQVYDIPRLEREVLPRYFKHSKFTSFQRQLNNFNFHKWTKTRANVCTFSHDALVQCHPNQLNAMVADAHASSRTAPTASPLRSVSAKRQRCESENDVTFTPLSAVFDDFAAVVEPVDRATLPKRVCVDPIQDMDIDRTFDELTATSSPVLLLNIEDVSDLLVLDWTQATAATDVDTISSPDNGAVAATATSATDNSNNFVLPEDEALLFGCEAAVDSDDNAGSVVVTKLALDEDALAALLEETNSVASITSLTRSISIVSSISSISSISSDGSDDDAFFGLDDAVMLQLEDEASWTASTTIAL
ncbi:hypothetical protein PybrP1_001837 [[Pythium] brassicae (nom. inval.)]|nr:hypothetical protein PybrP1_001837 [[Pythium] brassicae (nom. inval.)]